MVTRIRQAGCVFQSTLSVRRATISAAHAVCDAGISIHALREESDAWSPVYGRQDAYFNPRSP